MLKLERGLQSLDTGDKVYSLIYEAKFYNAAYTHFN